jgi:cytochrome b subunit of formate dehydrogenase
MMLIGFLGVVSYATTKRPTPPRAGAYGRGQDVAARFLSIPMMIVGVVGIVLWILDVI